MTDLTPEQVRTLAGRIGLTIGDGDLEDVTFRLNAILGHLAALAVGEAAARPASLADAN